MNSVCDKQKEAKNKFIKTNVRISTPVEIDVQPNDFYITKKLRRGSPTKEIGAPANGIAKHEGLNPDAPRRTSPLLGTWIRGDRTPPRFMNEKNKIFPLPPYNRERRISYAQHHTARQTANDRGHDHRRHRPHCVESLTRQSKTSSRDYRLQWLANW